MFGQIGSLRCVRARQGKRSSLWHLYAVERVAVMATALGHDFLPSDWPTPWPDGGLHGGLAPSLPTLWS